MPHTLPSHWSAIPLYYSNLLAEQLEARGFTVTHSRYRGEPGYLKFSWAYDPMVPVEDIPKALAAIADELVQAKKSGCVSLTQPDVIIVTGGDVGNEPPLYRVAAKVFGVPAANVEPL